MAMTLPAAVIFDVDGTLVDSERHGHRIAFNRAFAELGLPDQWDEATYGRLLDITGGKRRLERYLLDNGYHEDEASSLAAALHGRKTELFRQLVDEGQIPARPGVGRLLDELAAASIPVAVATTGSRAWVSPLLERLFGLDRFALVLTGTEVPDRKPDPAVYHEALERLGAPARWTVAVEDSANGLAAARSAAIPCLVVVNDYTAGQDFSGATLVVDGFDGAEPVTIATLARIVADPNH
jgi:HAD superfamily hydrolase (TIGR01509 family)